MNGFLLAPISSCVSEIVRGEMSEAVRARERVSNVNLSGARCRRQGKRRMKECLTESQT